MNAPTPQESFDVIQDPDFHVETMWEDNKKKLPHLNFLPSFGRRFGVANQEQKYPIGRNRCDVVVGKVKFAWTYTEDHKPGESNPWFDKHLFGDKVSGLKDLRDNLPTLIASHEAERIGFTLVVFDSIQRPFDLAKIAKLECEAKVRLPWMRDERGPWVNPGNAEACKIRAFYWERSA